MSAVQTHLVITIRLKRCFPSETALTIAVRSAQIARPYDTFSTLQPVEDCKPIKCSTTIQGATIFY